MNDQSEFRIGIDFHVAGGIYQGVRTYLVNLILEIVRLNKKFDFFVYTKDPDKVFHWKNNYLNLTLKNLPTSSGRFNLLFGFPTCAFLDRLSLFHSQYVLPVYLPCKSVLTIHDILFESHPEFFPEFHRRMLKFFIPYSARRASKIISVSEFTKKEIMKYYHIPEDKITVTYEGASDKFIPLKNRNDIFHRVKRYGIKKRYILFVGRIEPRKNIAGLIKAFNYIKQRGCQDVNLVIVGNQDKIFEENQLPNLIKDIPYSSDIVFTGGVSEEDLIDLYNGAQVLAYPAFAEGFGLPVLEAMACGTPVITSNITSLPEVAGDSALLVNPCSFQDIGEALERILNSQELRKELSEKGLQRSQMFKWQEVAKRTVKVYQEVLE